MTAIALYLVMAVKALTVNLRRELDVMIKQKSIARAICGGAVAASSSLERLSLPFYITTAAVVSVEQHFCKK